MTFLKLLINDLSQAQDKTPVKMGSPDQAEPHRVPTPVVNDKPVERAISSNPNTQMIFSNQSQKPVSKTKVNVDVSSIQAERASKMGNDIVSSLDKKFKGKK